MAYKKSIVGIVIVFVSLLVAAWPLFGNGFIPTHDGEYHIIRFWQFDTMVRAGFALPRWAPSLNSGYGLPLFQFMYPFANYVATLFHAFGYSFVSTFKLSSAIAYILSGIFCFLWLQKRFGTFAATVGAIASAYVPYWFVNLYVRGVIGEDWAMVWVFCSLFAIEAGIGWLVTVAFAALILSHNILAMIFFPLLCIYLFMKRGKNHVYHIFAALGLSAWFWLPALGESKYMLGLNTVSFRNHFASVAELLIPSWGTEFSGQFGGSKMSFQIGLGPLIWMLIALSILPLKRYVTRKKEIVVLLCTVAIACVLMLPISYPVWKLIWPLQLIQYPWRLLVLFIPVTGYLVALIAHLVKRRWISVSLVAFSVLLTISYTRGAVYEPRHDEHYLSRRNFTDGTSSLGNALSTVWSPWKSERPKDTLLDTKNESLPHTVITNKYLYKKYSISLPQSADVRLPITYFPGWIVYVDGKPTDINYVKNGTLDVRIEQGTHTIVAAMQETPLRVLADLVTLASLAVCVFWGILRIYAHRN